MSLLAEETMRQLLKRTPTADDYQRLNEMLSALPSEVRSSPAAMSTIVMALEFLRQMEELVDKASWEAQQQIHKDLPQRIDSAAYAALNKLRDLLPIDSKDAARRLYRNVMVCSLIAAILTGFCGTILGAHFTRSERHSMQAYYNREFGQCVDAASEAFINGAQKGSRTAPVSRETVRMDLMMCTARYADRRTESS